MVVFLAAFPFFSNLREDAEVKRKWYDSLYFFGFILTLMALIMALGHVGRFSGVQLSVIIVQNAIALSSTVFALIFRTLLVLFIPIEAEEEFETLQTLQSRVEDLAEKFEGLTTAVGTFGDQMDETKVAIKGVGAKIGTEVGRIVEELQNRAQDLSEIEIDKELIADQMAEAAKLALDQVESEIANLKDGISNGGRDIQSAVGGLSTAMATLEQAMGDGAGNVSEGLGAIDTAMTNAAASIETSVGEGVQTFETAFDGMAIRLASVEVSDLVEKKLSALMDDVAKQVHRHQAQLDTGVADLFKSLESNAETHVELGRQTEEFTRIVARDKERLDALEQALAGLTERVSSTFLSQDWHEEQTRKLSELRASNVALQASLDGAMGAFNAFAARADKPGVWMRFKARAGRLFNRRES